MDNFNLRKNVSDSQECKLKLQCLTTQQNVLFAEGNCMNSKTGLQVRGTLKCLLGKVQDWNPKILEKIKFFSSKGASHEELAS